MTKYHINSNGDVKPCKATQKACQFGDTSLHFDNESGARAYVEKVLAKDSTGYSLRGKKKDSESVKNKLKDNMYELVEALIVGEEKQPSTPTIKETKQNLKSSHPGAQSIGAQEKHGILSKAGFIQKRLSADKALDFGEILVPMGILSNRVVAFYQNEDSGDTAILFKRTPHKYSTLRIRKLDQKQKLDDFSIENPTISNAFTKKINYSCPECKNKNTIKFSDLSKNKLRQSKDLRCKSCEQSVYISNDSL